MRNLSVRPDVPLDPSVYGKRGKPPGGTHKVLLRATAVLRLLLVLLALAGLTPNARGQLSGAFTRTGNMRTARYNHTATLLQNGKVLIAGGHGPGLDDYLASAELYDPATRTFVPTGSMTSARQFHTSTLLRDCTVLVTGGRGYNGRGYWRDLLASAELYDPATGTFTPTGEMFAARMVHTATLLPDGKVLIAGRGEGSLGRAEVYDPVAGVFGATDRMITGWAWATASLLANGKVLIAGGETTAGPSPNAELYDPVTGAFGPTGDMIVGTSSHTATVLANGTVLIAGGSVGFEGLPSFDRAELFDPATGRFSDTGSMTRERQAHTATLLPDGTVLIVGGNSAELYNPAAGSFSPTGNLTTVRGGHTATLLPDGRVLVAGGADYSKREKHASAELYEPAAGTLPVLTLGSTQYCVGDSWNLKVSNGAAHASVRLLGTSNGQPWEIGEWRRTDARGSFNAEGKFAEGTEGSHTLKVDIGGVSSNGISFVVSKCTPADLNGAYTRRQKSDEPNIHRGVAEPQREIKFLLRISAPRRLRGE